MTRILTINIDDLLHARGVESARLGFKASWNTGPTALQVLHTICAFANDLQNLNGGYIILGVAEQNGVAQLPPAGLQPDEIDKIQKWLQGRCKSLAPEYQPVLAPEIVDGKHILVIWAPGSDTRPHQAPVALEKGAARAYFVRLGSQTVEARDEILTQLLQLTAKVPFDDRQAREAPIEKLRETLVREFLSDIRSKLIEEPDGREIYRQMRIASRINGHEVSRNVGLLFFSDAPEEWFPGARIEIVQFAADTSGNVLEEKTFQGPIHHQLRSAIRYLRDISTRHLEKLGDRPEVKGWVSYPLPALEEALANAVYHRSYERETPEPIKVYLYPDRIEVISYPGPVQGVELHHLAPGGRVPPVPARNRRIGEFLKELRLAEGRGTGIPKVYRSMQENGSPAPLFDFDGTRTYFRVILPAHPAYVAITALRDAAHLRAIGDVAGALERLRRAYAERPDSAMLASTLITELARESALAEAQQVFEQFYKTDAPDRSRAVAAISTALLDAGRTQDARAMLDRLPEFLTQQEAIEAAILERRADRQERAHRYFTKAGDAVYRDVRALHELAQTKMKLADLRRGRRGEPYKRDTRQRLLREARDMLERVLQMDAPPTRHAWAWFDLGRVLRWLRAPETEVRHAFEQACKLLPHEKRFQEALQRLEESSE